jgi:hypothetical protein
MEKFITIPFLKKISVCCPKNSENCCMTSLRLLRKLNIINGNAEGHPNHPGRVTTADWESS